MNFISWENGQGKTNILEAVSIFFNSILDIDFSLLIKKWEDFLYIEILLDDGKKIAISYEKETNKKKYIINWKNTTKKKIREIIPSIISFHPLVMNLMYLWPSKRRLFLDQILGNTFEQYGKILKKYKKIITSRNKVLKNISEWKSDRNEILFWNEQFLETACLIYRYREWLINFFENHINNLDIYMSGKIQNIIFSYITKIDRNSPKKSLQKYLKNNLERDILLRKTFIWPHIDDFNILLDGVNLIDFASRWEVKSIIIALKFIEAKFIKQYTEKESIFLIDDLLSELDENHKNMIFNNLWKSQTIITSIKKLDYKGEKIFL